MVCGESKKDVRQLVPVLKFLELQMDRLRPGGITVHITEFKLSSSDDMLADRRFVIYRLRDIEAVCQRPVGHGHRVENGLTSILEITHSTVVDAPPCLRWATDPPAKIKHL